MDAFTEIVGLSPGLRTMMARVSMVAATNTTVLITGETGTGKELVARAIHDAQPRAAGAVRRGQLRARIPEGLLESELFGHEKGAFTGAARRQQGRFELADGGTLFLDEIGELAARAAGEAAARAAGARVRARRRQRDASRSTCGIVAATNRDLRRDGRATARSARTSTTGSTSSRSRCRRCASAASDIPLLAEHFLRRYAQRTGRVRPRLSRRGDAPRSTRTAGRATSASSRTSSSARWCSRPVTCSTWTRCPISDPARAFSPGAERRSRASGPALVGTASASAADPAHHRATRAQLRRAGAGRDGLGHRGRARCGAAVGVASQHAPLAAQAMGHQPPGQRSDGRPGQRLNLTRSARDVQSAPVNALSDRSRQRRAPDQAAHSGAPGRA